MSSQDSRGYVQIDKATMRRARYPNVFSLGDCTMKPHPAIPLINTQKERYDIWFLKRHGLPQIRGGH
ncbi:MAG: hypothetical protein ACRDOH_10550 [Streptosporangiaceae bacterium]